MTSPVDSIVVENGSELVLQSGRERAEKSVHRDDERKKKKDSGNAPCTSATLASRRGSPEGTREP